MDGNKSRVQRATVFKKVRLRADAVCCIDVKRGCLIVCAAA